MKTVNINNAFRGRIAFASWIKLKCLFTQQVVVVLQIFEVHRTVIECMSTVRKQEIGSSLCRSVGFSMTAS